MLARYFLLALVVATSGEIAAGSSPSGHAPDEHGTVYSLTALRSGAIYVHWGRPDCMEDSELIYSGTAAGSSHKDTPGAGSNVLCLPHDPDFVNPDAGEGEIRAFLYSVEYEISDSTLYQHLNTYEVSCAVCKATGRFSQLMIPGKHACPSNDWTLEYEGYLMAERSHEDHYKSMFICVDRDSTPVPGTDAWANENSGRLCLVEPNCSVSGGGLPCGIYTAGYEFTCAVCTL